MYLSFNNCHYEYARVHRSGKLIILDIIIVIIIIIIYCIIFRMMIDMYNGEMRKMCNMVEIRFHFEINYQVEKLHCHLLFWRSYDFVWDIWVLHLLLLFVIILYGRQIIREIAENCSSIFIRLCSYKIRISFNFHLDHFYLVQILLSIGRRFKQ